MTVNVFPGDLRIGVIDEALHAKPRPPATRIDPKFLVMVLLNGTQTFFIDDQHFSLDASRTPKAIMLQVYHTAQLQFDIALGTPYRKVALATPLKWLEQLQADEGKMSASLVQSDQKVFHQIWTPDAEIVRLATQVLAPPPQNSMAQTELFRMSRGLELLRRTLMTSSETQTEPMRDAHPISERIRLYVLKNIDNDLSLPRIEMDLGMNRRSIQRHFKIGTGETLSNFIRHQRLTRARRALSEDGMSISQAAHLAGYSTPENFSAAFQTAFGLAPQRLRNGSI